MSFIDLLWFVAGLVGGIVSDWAISLYLSRDQFCSSTGGYRLDKTIDATREIIGAKDRSALRDKYRYSLGVIIDELESIWRKGDFKEDAWPRLVHFADGADGRPCLANQEGKPDPKADRWALFNQYIRPVIEDISSFSFLGRYRLARWLSKKIRQLNALTKLCNKLETVVSEFDAAYEAEQVKLARVNDKVVIEPIPNSDPKELREAYRHLCYAWREWRKLSCGKAD